MHDTKQGNLAVIAYYNMITQLWKEMDLYQDQDWICVEEMDVSKVTAEAFKLLLTIQKLRIWGNQKQL